MPLVGLGLPAAIASTPDHASLNIGDLDVRVWLSMDFWGPIFFTTHLISQWQGTELGWTLSIHQNQHVRLGVTVDGANILGPESTVALSYTGGIQPHWLRATLDVNDGAGNRVFNYYTSEDGSAWNSLGTTITEAGAITIFNSTVPLTCPGPTALTLFGRIYYAEVRNGIAGTIVANPDFGAQTPGTTSFNDSTGKTWTIGSPASIDTGINPQQISVLP